MPSHFRSHARLRGLTLEQRVWRCLRRSPHGLSPRELAREMAIGIYSAKNALCRLRRKGAARSEGATLAIRYFATERAPDDWRGVTQGSLRALQEHGPKRTRQARPKRTRPGDELSRVWVGA